MAGVIVDLKTFGEDVSETQQELLRDIYGLYNFYFGFDYSSSTTEVGCIAAMQRYRKKDNLPPGNREVIGLSKVVGVLVGGTGVLVVNHYLLLVFSKEKKTERF